MSLSNPTVDFAISQQGRPPVILLQRLPKPPNLRHSVSITSPITSDAVRIWQSSPHMERMN